MGKKERWVRKVRALRAHLKMLKDRGEITKDLFNSLYRQIKGGQVRSVRHLKELVKQSSRR
ncbi:MAG: 50S ribosomal protein L19e, partial [Nitrososphaerota archaeon]